MDSNDRARGETHWGAVGLGWVISALAGVAISALARLAYGFFAEPPLGRGELTAAVVVVSLVSGFLAYLIGGYAAARLAGHSGGRHGALAALLGLVVGIVLASVLSLFGVLFAGGVAVPPAGFGLAGAALLAGLVLFLANLFGGYVGGKLGEPAHPGTKRV